MNKTEYRRSLIMLRSLRNGLSGYVRLERRTLTGTLQFTVNGVSPGQELHAALLRKQNGSWIAVRTGSFSAPRYGQSGLVWSFDPRAIDGKAFELYSLAAVISVTEGICDLLLCGTLNGSPEVDWAQVRDAACRLFSPVRIDGMPIPPIDESLPSDEPSSFPASPGGTAAPPSPEADADPDSQDNPDKAVSRGDQTISDKGTSSGNQSASDKDVSTGDQSASDKAVSTGDQSPTDSHISTAPAETDAAAPADDLDIPAAEPDAPAASFSASSSVSSRTPGRTRDAQSVSFEKGASPGNPLDSSKGISSVSQSASAKAASPGSQPPTDSHISTAPAETDAAAPADDLDIPAAEPDGLDAPAASDNRKFLIAARAARSPENPQAKTGSATESAGNKLGLTDPAAPWHESIEPLRGLFFSSEAVTPFDAADYVLIQAPLPSETGMEYCVVGIRAENGDPRSVLYAIPARYTPEPPPGLDGYIWLGDRTGGYWITEEPVPPDAP